MAEVDLVDAGAVLHVQTHAGDGGDEVDLQGGVTLQLVPPMGFSREGFVGQAVAAGLVGLLDLLDGLEHAGAAGDAVLLQRRGDRQADGLIGTGGIRNHQMGGQGIQSPFYTFYGSVEGF